MASNVPTLSSTHVVHILLLLLLNLSFVQCQTEWNLPDQNEALDLLTAYQMKEQRRSLWLEGRTSSNMKLGERCGNRNTCDQDLQCTPVVLGRRCLPKNCLEIGFTELAQGFNLTDYKRQILSMAGVQEDQLRQEMKDAVASGDRTSFLYTNVFQSIREAMAQNPAPSDAIFDMYDRCAGEHVNGTAQRVDFQGLHFEGGVVVDGVVDFLWERSTGDAFVRYCYGFNWIGGAEMSFLYLIAQNTDSPDDITDSCTFRTDVNFGIGVNLGVGTSYAVSPNGQGILEFTAGLGASISAGVGWCTISRA